jgi:outer membrane protein OmpA-like peptidoglycan-associated protein
VGKETREGIDCAVIKIDYEVFHKATSPEGTVRMYPIRVVGESHQKYWWDVAGRKPIFYDENFDFVFSFNTGDDIEFKGNADGRLIQSPPLDRAQVAQEIQKQIGVTITMENVNFPPNSDALMPAEQEKLRRIAEVLKKYQERDIAITGHTARAQGYTEEDYQKLSDQRAQAAANFLLSIGARRAEQITSRGMGARIPVGDNSTEEGRRMNRRVEITILEN